MRDLQSLSRSSDTELQLVDVGECVESAANLAGTLLRSRAKVSKRLTPTPLVNANPTRLGQVFLNLMVNAAQAISEGNARGNEIEISVGFAVGEVVVAIRDTGTGIPLPLRQRIFEPFFTTKPAGQGTGLGLAICRGIVVSLGGRVEVESEPGIGSTFMVVLPAAASPVATAPRPPEAIAPLPTGRQRIMLIDDDPLVLAAVERVLATDYEVLAVQSPREAIERLFDGEKVDLIVSDLVMPEIGGEELAARIAEESPEQSRRLVFLTAGPFSEAGEQFVNSRPPLVLRKPLNSEQLRDAVQALLARKP